MKRISLSIVYFQIVDYSDPFFSTRLHMGNIHSTEVYMCYIQALSLPESSGKTVTFFFLPWRQFKFFHSAGNSKNVLAFQFVRVVRQHVAFGVHPKHHMSISGRNEKEVEA